MSAGLVRLGAVAAFYRAADKLVFPGPNVTTALPLNSDTSEALVMGKRAVARHNGQILTECCADEHSVDRITVFRVQRKPE